MTDSLDEKIASSASGPKKVSGDGVSVEQHPIADQIAAEKFLQSKKASQRKGLGIRLQKISPGGTV